MISVSQHSALNRPPFINGAEFRSLSISYQSKPVAISFQRTKSFREQKTPPQCEIKFLDFDSKFTFNIVEIENELPDNQLSLYLGFDDNIFKVNLSGEWRDNEGLFVNNYSFDVIRQGETPKSVFLLKTFWAMLGLSAKLKIKIPILNQEATMSFDSNLNAISEQLQTRQIAYRLMVIEKTFKVKLPVPEFIQGEDVENIAYCYNSVINRKFKWFCPPAKVTWYATAEYFSLLPQKNLSFPVQYGPEPLEKKIFNYNINLGLQIARIEDYILDNFDEVKEELSKLDGREVWVQSRSKNGVMEIQALTTPNLPENAFNQDIQKLIDLEEKLDSKFFDKYTNSFSNAFDGLTNEQIEAITEQPNLDEEAFNF